MAKDAQDTKPAEPVTEADLHQDALEAIKETPSNVAGTDADRKRELAEKDAAAKEELARQEAAAEEEAEAVAAEAERRNPTRAPAKGKDWIDAQHGSNADWFREQRVKDLERELQGAVERGDKEYQKAVRAELASMGHGQKTAEKRPAARAKETR